MVNLKNTQTKYKHKPIYNFKNCLRVCIIVHNCRTQYSTEH